MCPSKTFKIKQVKQPWISPRLIGLIRDKDRALKKEKKVKTLSYRAKLRGSEMHVQRE